MQAKKRRQQLLCQQVCGSKMHLVASKEVNLHTKRKIHYNHTQKKKSCILFLDKLTTLNRKCHGHLAALMWQR